MNLRKLSSFKIILSSVFFRLIKIWPGKYFYGVFLLCIFWTSWICGLVFLTNLGKFLVIIPLNISSIPYSFHLLVFLLCVFYNFCYCPIVFVIFWNILFWFLLLFFYSLCISVMEVSINIFFKFTDNLFGCIPVC